MKVFAVIIAVALPRFLTSCADNPSFDNRLATLQQQRERQRVEFHNEMAAHRAASEKMSRLFHERLAQIEQLPLNQQEAALDRLQRDEEAWHRDQEAWYRDRSAALDRQSRDLDNQQMINGQQNLTDAINDLSDELEQARIDRIGR